MIGERHPALDRDSLILDVRQLERREDTDYLYLVRREKSCLSRKMQEWLEQGRDSSLLELIQSMKGGEPVWTQAEKLPT